ncbi:hypothetical protein PSET11_01920 [Arthrobacter ulcerisalmonis]|uniref:V8-like Glu-specific endopeptidase n=1 Tax=Arthrobacter ulcerisalmonis TaxID=2483813 RepID=A0A3P5X0Z4_9MICC|nr:hypothetical protein [Arthrobacter ulcerisalmonis]VDC27601.1 hypothetical protein PSET11_01920 [Arthrobacter ulcerisalmonis]
MTRTRSLATSLLTFSAAAILALSAAGSANAAPTKDTTPSVTGTAVNSAGAADYWTADRMTSAIPADQRANSAVQRSLGLERALVAKGAPSSVEPLAATTPVLRAASESPVAHIGKIFFTQAGQNYVCSGNSVAAANKSTVSTAGHCLNEGPGAFVTNFVFVPAYNNGAAPYGKWAAKALYAPTQWSGQGDIQYDTGFAVVSPLNGRTLADTVGASGVQFNAARGLTYKAFGYPAASPFNGQTLKSCAGTATNDTVNPGGTTQGIPCDMTGGSSGGPWFVGSSSTGKQNSVNSYGYGQNSTKMYGPYWGSVIQQTYATAAAS